MTGTVAIIHYPSHLFTLPPRTLVTAAAQVLVEARWRWKKVRTLHLLGKRASLNEDVVRAIIVQATILGCI